MFGRWRRTRTGGSTGAGTLSGLAVPESAGLVSFRLLDPVAQPVHRAEVRLADSAGQSVVEGESDPYGLYVAAVPPGSYRLAVSADGYTPHRANVEVRAGGVTALGDVPLDLATPPELPPAGDWQIDPTHTNLRFVARHIGMAKVHGAFDSFAGGLRIGERMSQSQLHVVIDAASINTNVKMRDDHLRSADFLDVEHFPQLEFYSDRFVHKGGNRWAVTGGLTIHGITRTVTLDTRYLGTRQGIENETRAACTATTELHREDFTLNWQHMLARGIAVVGSSIRIELDIQALPAS